MYEVYLQPSRDSVTGMIQCSIPDFFVFYVLHTEDYHDTSCNIDTVFKKIQDFQDLCIMINNDKMDTQLVTYVYLIFQKSSIFMDSLTAWNMKIASDRTFANLKIHMRKDYLDLQEVGGPINNLSLSQANMIQELKVHQEAIINNMK